MLKNISYKEQDKLLIENATFNLDHKEKIAIIGKNGVGKSTLLKIVAGLKERSGGEMEIFHHKIDKLNDYDIHRDAVAYLPQTVNDFFIANVVIEDVMFSLRAIGIDKDEAYKKSLEILQSLGILHLENRVIYELSGGEKKLVALAGILIKEPKLLLLDEPTNDLDSQSEERIVEILRAIEQSMIIVSHQESFIEKLASKTYMLENGLLKELDLIVVSGGCVRSD